MNPLTDITQEELRTRFHYDPDTGILYRSWKKRGLKATGYLNKEGYLRVGLNRKLYQAHRLIWIYVHGDLNGLDIDHIDGNRSNNKITNLRAVTRQENLKNTSLRDSNSSGFVGVYWYASRNKWTAQIAVDGRCKSLGYFMDKSEAAAARKAAEVKYGYHANHGK